MEQLGIEPIQLLTQLINFAIMVAVLTKLLYKPVLKSLEERRKKIAEGLAYAEKMKSETEKTDVKRQAIVNSAKEEASKIIEEAKKSAKVVEAEIIEKAHEEEQGIIEKGRADLEMERLEMEKQLKEQTVAIAEAIAGKVLASSLSAADQRAIIAKKIKTIAKQLSP